MYLFIRDDLKIPFYTGKDPLDTSLQTIFHAIKGEKITDVVKSVFKDVFDTEPSCVQRCI